jgi:hypothetical protein
VVFWGDSYVEAYQVADTRKMAGALTTLCRSRPGGQALTAGSAGRSGQSLADYILQIPAYERAAGVPRLHVVILADIEDLLPDQGSAHHARFLSQPDFRLAGDRPMSGFERAARTVLADWHLQVLDTLESRFLGVLAKKPLWRRLRFRPGPVDRALAAAGPEPAAGAVTTPEATAAIDYILKELRQATAAPVLLVYCPTVPHLVNGAAVFGDAQAAAFQVVETRAGLARVPLITMGGAFAEHFRATRRLPRGFANSRVGEGHLNEDGHRLVAVAVLDHLNRSSSPP